MATKRTLVLIPAHNEEEFVGAVVRKVRDLHPSYDVVVVDDGSRDRTGPMAAGAGAEVISHPVNRGYGEAIHTGYKYAITHGYDFLVQMDGDGQHDPASVSGLLGPVQAGECDFALGSRFLGPRNYVPRLIHRIGMAFFGWLVSWLIGQPITDSTSGFQAFNSHVIRFLATEFFPCDYPDADMLVALHRAGFSLREVPVRMSANASGESMHGGLKPFYYLFKMLLSVLLTLVRQPKRS